LDFLGLLRPEGGEGGGVDKIISLLMTVVIDKICQLKE